ncbi:MAG: hypothetical protein ACK4M9_12980 [Anaerobacillus sp.]|uniref:hypothetical protein n=1 Tax=Anaerobacillus sp. TaxID=1872506 RepID=UPI003918F3C8
MEFPFDLSLIWLSLILSMLLLMAYIIRCNVMPSIKSQNRKDKSATSVIKEDIPVSFFTERLHTAFRKIPTKELGSNSLDEDQPSSFSKSNYFFNLEEDIFNGNSSFAHISYT